VRDDLFDEVRLAPAIDLDNEHIRTFLVFGLSRALEDFQCGKFESQPIIDWYWRTAPTWIEQPSQAAFDKYARARVSDKIGYDRRRSNAWSVVDQLFDKARFSTVTFSEVIAAITFLTPTEDCRVGIIENDRFAILDVTKRSDSPKLLKVDVEFLPTLKTLYPWTREDDTVIKTIPIGSTTRELDLLTLACWLKDSKLDVNRMTRFQFENLDPLDWTGSNVSLIEQSDWGSNERFYPTPKERTNLNGETILISPPSAVVIDGSMTRATLDPVYARASASAGVLNRYKEPADVARLRRDVASLG
jgi:hypothetical protein